MDRVETLFNFNAPFDPTILDEVVQIAYTGRGGDQKTYMEILNRFQQHEDAWLRVDQILETCKLPQSKYCGLAIMEKLIQFRWKIIPESQRDAMKNFLVNVMLKDSSSPQALYNNKLYLGKLNLIIVEILKKEWPHNWPNFITDLLAASRGNLSMCENNMKIFQFLSEELYDFSEDQLTQNKKEYLQKQMKSEFGQIYQLCLDILEKAQTEGLVIVTLETLLKFLNWIPLDFVFESNVLDSLITRFLPMPAFRNLTIKCFTQIVCQKGFPQYEEKMLQLLVITLENLKATLPDPTVIAQAYENGNDTDQDFIQDIAIFLTSFFDSHLPLVESKNVAALLLGHEYLVQISTIEERELFKICLDYWNNLLSGLFNEMKRNPDIGVNRQNLFAQESCLFNPNEGHNLRKSIYAEILSKLRYVMIERMVKPEEVLVVENEDGEVVREFTKETDTVVLYKSMRECLVYLTHMDVQDTQNIMDVKLSKHFEDGKNWSTTKFNRLCWSIGTISGAMCEDRERRFLVNVIKTLLSLCDLKKGKDDKAIVASNIMYCVGQYPRFLRNHWKFLQTVVNKLFEFMHESHNGIQDMACDTFNTVVLACKRHFVVAQNGQPPFLGNMITTLPTTLRDLSSTQKVSVYTSFGHIISAIPNIADQEASINDLLIDINRVWAILINDSTSLEDNDKVKELGYCLKVYTGVCSAVGQGFKSQLSLLFNDTLKMFKTISMIIDACIVQQGEIGSKTVKVRNLRVVRKQSLRLIEAFINRSSDVAFISTQLIPPLVQNFLTCYRDSSPISKEAEILDLFSTCAEKLGTALSPNVQFLLENTLQCTIDMISSDFAEYPDVRISFYSLLHKLTLHSFPGIIALSPNIFEVYMLTITFGYKHTMRDISETALSITHELFKQVTKLEPAVRDSFFQVYLLRDLNEILAILFDGEHKNGFHTQCKTLSFILDLIESGIVETQLNNNIFPRDPSAVTNSIYVQQYLVSMLKAAYPHQNLETLKLFAQGMFLYSKNLDKFKLHVRDFLISLKEFGSDNSDLYLADSEILKAQREKEERAQKLQVPGMLKPSEIESGMED